MASNLANQLGHLKNHVKYPSTQKAIVATCNNMEDVPKEDREWFMRTLPQGRYENADAVIKAILTKV